MNHLSDLKKYHSSVTEYFLKLIEEIKSGNCNPMQIGSLARTISVHADWCSRTATKIATLCAIKEQHDECVSQQPQAAENFSAMLNQRSAIHLGKKK